MRYVARWGILATIGLMVMACSSGGNVGITPLTEDDQRQYEKAIDDLEAFMECMEGYTDELEGLNMFDAEDARAIDAIEAKYDTCYDILEEDGAEKQRMAREGK